MENIVIGKHTLESLTSGMYSDPYVVYREYIQNATDSIDDAVRQGLLRSGEDSINIDINPSERRISIIDNGCGVPSSLAEKTLISIGNSRKDSSNSRGFRGIGRLSALSYCSKLTFETSSFSEKLGTQIVIDSKQLSELLGQSSDEDVSVLDVLQQVYTCSTYPEKENQHYFRVILDGVDTASELTNIEEVVSYISQNAPVPYDRTVFPWGYEITQRIRKEGITIRSYNISVCCGTLHQQVFKPYKSEFLSDKGKQIYDKIHDIEIVKFLTSEGAIAAIGWVAKTSFLGSIYDKSIKGLRIRKGNILIGDGQTLNILFKDPRFNGWSIGEIFAIDPYLIPNARRDNFEKNAAYFSLIEQMIPIAAKIAKEIRSASAARNHELSSALKTLDDVRAQASHALESGVKSSQKGSLKDNLTQTQALLESISTNGDVDSYIQEIAFEELDMLLGRIKGATTYKALNTLDNLNVTEKHILERVFNLLIASGYSRVDEIIDIILSGFSSSSS